MLGQPGGSWASQLESQVPEFRAVGAGGGAGGRGSFLHSLGSRPRRRVAGPVSMALTCRPATCH